MSIDNRRITTCLTVTDRSGVPVSSQPITVRQVRHELEIGSAGFIGVDQTPELQHLWLDLYDTATLPFYWGRYEPRRGETQREPMLRSARWFAEQGVRIKGHPLVWHTVKAPWVDDLPLAEAEALLRARIRREVADFAGLIDTWDVINEVVIMPRFTNEPDGKVNAITRLCADKGRVEMVRMAVEEAHAAGTSPRLVLNDFDLGPEYEHLIEELLAADVRVDAIGLQSHMHKGFRGEDYLASVCERFARFALPLHWTETTLVSGDVMPGHIEDLNDYVVESWPSTPTGEARQADELVRHYTTLASFPEVASITYWGFQDGHMWLNAPGGVIRADGSPKPSYHALRELVRGAWWHEPTELVTDDRGRVAVTGLAGDYEVSAGGAPVPFVVTAGDPARTIVLEPGPRESAKSDSERV